MTVAFVLHHGALRRIGFATWLVVALAGAAVAQTPAAEQDPDEESEPGALEVVEVIGYRIKRTSIEGPAPVDVFTQAQILESGAPNLADFFRSLPQTLGQSSDVSQGSGLAGADYLDLRGIGIDNTLTLINGKRIAAYQRNGAAAPFVDINAIPVAAIERVEILKDGASALYGADAVAGVVNIILLDHFDGLQLGGGYLVTGEGDGEEWSADAIWGWHSADTELLVTASLLDRSPVMARDREVTADVDYSDLGGPNLRAFNSTPTNYFTLDTFELIADPACGSDPNITSTQFFPFFGTACLFNYAWFQQLTYDTQTVALTGALEHSFRDTLHGRLELIVNRRDTDALMAPTPVLGGIVPANHPDNVYGIPLEIAGRPLDTGDRVFSTEADSTRLVAGLEGEFSRWNWSADVAWSSVESDTLRRNAVLSNRYYAALAGMGGESGDLWYSPFGASPRNSPGLIDWMTTDSRYGAEQTESALELAADTSFWQLPGGPVGLALGAQFREQALDEYADETERSGQIAGGSQVTQINADRDVFAAYAELKLPLTESLEAQLAVRYDDYSDFGDSTNPKVGLAWRITEGFMLRGSYATSFRPPTFTELFNPETLGSSFYQDVERCEVTGAALDCAQREYPQRNVGNDQLQPEEGESTYLGLLAKPGFGLEMELAYWRFEHSERIILLNPQLVLDARGDFGVVRQPPSAEDIALGIPGPIAQVTATYVNSDELVTSGWDAAARWRTESSRGSQWGLDLVYTHVERYELNEALVGSAESGVNFAGRYFNGQFGIPEHRGNLSGNWQRDAHSATVTVNYTGDYEGPYEVAGAEGPVPWIVEDWTTLDLQYAFRFNDDRTLLRLGCRNCTDEAPPVTFNAQGDGLYDYRGALWYGRVEYHF